MNDTVTHTAVEDETKCTGENNINRNEKGQFTSDSENTFDSETGKEVAVQTAWENRRENILKKRFPNLWEEYKNE